jgi:hypothetical protein
MQRQKVIMVAKHMNEFAEFVYSSYAGTPQLILNRDKHYRLKLLIEEFNFTGIAGELLRLNKHSGEHRETKILLERFQSALRHVADYVDQNHSDLFLFSGRTYTMKHDCELLKNLLTEREP